MYFHSDPGWPADYRLDKDLHEPDQAVLLDAFPSGPILITWEMYGDDELLTVSTETQLVERGISLPSCRRDVSLLKSWPAYVNSRIASASSVVSDWSDSSVRIDFQGGAVRVSLGEWQANRLAYVPTALVVEFEPAPE